MLGRRSFDERWLETASDVNAENGFKVIAVGGVGFLGGS